MKNIALKKLLNIALIAGILFYGGVVLAAPAAETDEGEDVYDTLYIDEVSLIRGEVVTLKVYNPTRLALTADGVVTLYDHSEDKVIFIGEREGETTLFIWDDHGKRSVTFHVTTHVLEVTKRRIQDILKDMDLTGLDLKINEKEGVVVISGDIFEDRREDLDKALLPFGDQVINLVKDEEVKDLIQMDIQVTELSTTLAKAMGIDWSTGAGTTSSGTSSRTRGRSTGLNPTYVERFPSDLDGSVGDYFKIGQFYRSNSGALVARVNALLREGKAKILSRPKLVVVSGEEASFLVGGQIPIETTTVNGSTSQSNVSFKSYGISVTLIPEIIKEKIDISLNVEISDIDAANKVNQNVAFSTRSASTRLYLDNGEMIILAGLIRHTRNSLVNKVPGLWRIPLLGKLFRSKSTVSPDLDQEVVIALTPHILDRNRNKLLRRHEEKVREEIFKEFKKDDEEDSEQMDLTAQKNFTGFAPEAMAKLPPVSVPKNMMDYVKAVQTKIAQAISYPESLSSEEITDAVKLGLLILKDGTLAYAMVKESSGQDSFDKAALSAAKKIAPYAAFPPDTDLQELNITVPVVYKAKP